MDNILLCLEIIHNYHWKLVKENICTIKVDLMKAYDSVNFDFFTLGS